jgi:peptide/nickel transport system permease protein
MTVAADMVELPKEDTSAAVEAPSFSRNLLRKRLAVVCLVYLAVIVGIGILAPILMPAVDHQNAGDYLNLSKGPTWHHVLGTDSLGRDVLDRLLVGTWVTLVSASYAVVTALLIGVPLGLLAGYLGGWVDRSIGWLNDLGFSLPGIVIVLVVVGVFPHNTVATMVALGVLFSFGVIRITRAAVLQVREDLFVAAARVSGLSHPYIIFRHVFPRIKGVIIVSSALLASSSILAQTGLAFLGFLAPLPAPSWGGMVSDGISQIELQPWLIWPPGIITICTILAFGLLGDAARDAFAETWSGPINRPSRRKGSARLRKESAPAAAAANGNGASRAPAADALLSIENLSVAFVTGERAIRAVQDVTFDIRPGEALGLVGESGCGKSVTAMSILGLLPGTGQIESGRIVLEGVDLASLSEKELRSYRGKRIGLVSQEPMVALNPVFKVGWQLGELVQRHQRVSRREAKRRVIQLLGSVGLPEPEIVAQRYPHELSGGMAQRVAIARALTGEPKLLIADEPTTALDVTIQAEILDLLSQLQHERGMSILLVTHDWGVVAHMCDRAVVMYAGEVVERGSVKTLFNAPQHPYTAALLESNPHHAIGKESLPTIPGTVPKPGAWPSGCHFSPRCRYATAECREGKIPLEQSGEEHETRCIHHDSVLVAR